MVASGTGKPNAEILDFRTLLLLACSSLFSVSIVVCNKLVLRDFPYPITVTTCHFITNLIFTRCMNLAGVVSLKRVPWQPVTAIAAINIFSLCLVNYSLQVNLVTVYQSQVTQHPTFCDRRFSLPRQKRPKHENRIIPSFNMFWSTMRHIVVFDVARNTNSIRQQYVWSSLGLHLWKKCLAWYITLV